MQETELEKLRRGRERLATLQDRNNELELQNAQLEEKVTALKGELEDFDRIPFDIKSLPNEMKWEKLIENWEDISLDDLEAICRK